MSYIVPRVLINQEFTQQAVFGDQPLSSLIIGPQYKLFRYSVADEKPNTIVSNDDGESGNDYDPDTDVTYDFPNRPAGGKVDPNFTKVFLEKARAQYFPNTSLGSASATVTRVAVPNSSPTKYYNNRLTSSTVVFKTANSVDRNAVFSNRDVKVGDYVQITDGTIVQLSKIKALHAVKTAAAVTSPAVADTDNIANLAEDFNDAPVWVGEDTDPSGGRVTIANDSTGYLGYNALRVFEDTYTVEVTTGGDLTEVEFTITSANGVFATKTAQALATVSGDAHVLVIDGTGSDVVRLDFTGSTSFVEGDKWTLGVVADTTPLLPTVAGTYTGTKNLRYKLTVVRGGEFYDETNADDCARIAVTSDDVDSSATVNVADAVAFTVGSYGVTASFTTGSANGGLILGDIYYVDTVAEADGAVRTIETQDTLPAAFLAATGTWTAKLFLVKDLELKASRDGDTLNWEQDVTVPSITINAGLVTTDSLLVLGDDLVDLDIVAADIFVEHRDLLQTFTTAVSSVREAADVQDLLGTVHPDNVLAYGVYNSALNANGVTTYFVGVATDDLEGYNAAISLAKKANVYHGVTPLTFDPTIQDAVVAHVNSMSTAQNAKWRVAWLSRQLEETSPLYVLDEDEDNFTATVIDDPNLAGTNYNLVTMAGATFLTDEVRPTDEFRINYRLGASGETVYDTYIVDEVLTETTLKLTSGLDAAVNSAIKAEIHRVFTRDEQVSNLASVAGDYNNRRVRVVFPGNAKNGTTSFSGFHLAAACAGLRAGVVPHQGLTNTELLGVTDLSESVTDLTDDQLNVLAEAGVWIVTQSTVGATAYVRHQLTTDESSLNTSEDSITTNVDSISYGLQSVLEPFIGSYNRNNDTLLLIRNAINNELKFRQTNTYTVRAGNQLNGFEITKLEVNAAFADRIDVEIVLEVPYPYNFINLTLVV